MKKTNRAGNGQSSRKVPVIGIGASAGGLESIETFFRSMPTDTGMAFVIIQHLSPDFKSFMPEILSRKSKMRCSSVSQETIIRANEIYFLPPKKNLVIENGHLVLSKIEPPVERGVPNKPIDMFFSSLAQETDREVVAIILSGTGSDGARGILDVHNAGGRIYVESPESAKFDGMPNAAIATKQADFIGTASEIAINLAGIHSQQESVRQTALEDLHGTPKQKILQLVNERYGVDFTQYKIPTIQRRLDKRATEVQVEDIEEYLKYIFENPEEISHLYYELLIGVTHFFRDQQAFDVLLTEAIPSILAHKRLNEEIRIWVCGCASGEEVYSIAFSFFEVIRKSGKRCDFKIFATDIDDYILTKAADGIYTAAQLQSIDPDWVDRYFERVGNDFKIRAFVRKSIVFARHNVLTDPPFMNIDLVSCRNLLIYFDDKAQRRALSTFFFSLVKNGVLFLGPSEHLGKFDTGYTAINKQWNLHRKTSSSGVPREMAVRFTPPNRPAIKTTQPLYEGIDERMRRSDLDQALELLLQAYIPPSILLNTELDVTHVFGDTGRYLYLKPGRTKLNIHNLGDEKLSTAISVSTQRAKKSGEAISYRNLVPLATGESEEKNNLDVVVRPLTRRPDLKVVGFLASIGPAAGEPLLFERRKEVDLSQSDTNYINLLETELRTTKENLQATIEELETTNEELQSTNEEMLASNEELQSTNEELHSVNEELYTVNSEYQGKIEELTRLTADEENLLKSTKIGTIFLDSMKRVRKFTPSISEYFKLISSDIGRPLDHISSVHEFDGLMTEIDHVLVSGDSKEFERTTSEAKTFLIRIHPYRTEYETADGVVITFVEITKVKEAEKIIQEKAQALARSNQELEEFAYATSHDLKAPLRHIMNFIEMSESEVAKSGSDKLAHNFAQIVDSARVMSEMTTALLDLSRLGSSSLEYQDFSLASAVDDVAKFFSKEIREMDAKIEKPSEDSIVRGDRRLLIQVFQNLVQNALKYRKDNVDPIVQVSLEEEPAAWKIWIKDNGIGISASHSDRVFKIFQRLHREDSYGGLGIGLSLCKKIVELHGGEIGLQPEEGKGAQFYFTLPKRIESRG